MLKLTLDAQNNRITLEDNEIQANPFYHDPGDLKFNKADFELSQSGDLAKLTLNNVDFEGFVFTLIDPQGKTWSSEIIGLVNA